MKCLQKNRENRFADVAYDTVAAIVNDLCCAGALPLVVNAYFATGSSDWYREPERARALLEGWRKGCADAGCAWGGGESPTLPGLVAEGDIELAGAAVGAVPAGTAPILGQELRAGDEILLIHIPQQEQEFGILIQPGADSIKDGGDVLTHAGRVGAAAFKLDFRGLWEKAGFLLA